MKVTWVSIFLLISSVNVFAQCTVSASCAWNSCACDEGGGLSASYNGNVTIPNGVAVTSSGNSTTMTNTGDIIIQSGGTMTVDDSNVDTFGDIIVQGGGMLDIEASLNIGTTTGCGYTLIVLAGGILTTDGSSSDKLRICGQEVIRGGSGGACNGTTLTCTGNDGDPLTGLPLAFDEGGQNVSLLPVELIFFDAQPAETRVVLNWATATEENFDYFEIQRSLDLISFEEIGRASGGGDSETRRDYSFIDKNPYSGTSYYRLQSVDFDGYTEIFKAISVNVVSSSSLTIYPNPVTANFFTISYDRIADLKTVIILKDLYGRTVLEDELTDSNEIRIPDSLENGIYVVQLRYGGIRRLSRVVLRR